MLILFLFQIVVEYTCSKVIASFEPKIRVWLFTLDTLYIYYRNVHAVRVRIHINFSI